VIGIDGKEYPIPTQEQVVELFAHNRELEVVFWKMF